MVASSVSTYLDVTQSAGSGTAPSPAAPAAAGQGPVDTDTAAKVLAAIHAGTEVVPEIPEKAGLSTEAVLSAVAWLSESGLVTLDSSDGALRAQVTDAAKAALEQ